MIAKLYINYSKLSKPLRYLVKSNSNELNKLLLPESTNNVTQSESTQLQSYGLETSKILKLPAFDSKTNLKESQSAGSNYLMMNFGTKSNKGLSNKMKNKFSFLNQSNELAPIYDSVGQSFNETDKSLESFENLLNTHKKRFEFKIDTNDYKQENMLKFIENSAFNNEES